MDIPWIFDVQRVHGVLVQRLALFSSAFHEYVDDFGKYVDENYTSIKPAVHCTIQYNLISCHFPIPTCVCLLIH